MTIKLTGKVGAALCDNKVHDVALVQMMLRVIRKKGTGSPYLRTYRPGICDDATTSAIYDFQVANGIVPKPEKGRFWPKSIKKTDAYRASKGLAPKQKKDDAYEVWPNSVTLRKLTEALPNTHKHMRILKNTKTVYLSDTPARLATAVAASVAQVKPGKRLNRTFCGRVHTLIKRMSQTHGIVLWVARRSGFGRTFEEQAKLRARLIKNNPRAVVGRPGESFHNYGRAVDIGFRGMRWLKTDGTIVKDLTWLNKLDKANKSDFNSFWNARDKVTSAMNPKLHRIKSERVHAQMYRGTPRRGLARLLTKVSPGKRKWATMGRRHYTCDLGCGGVKVCVGTSDQIWAGKAAVSTADIAKVKKAKKAKSPAKAKTAKTKKAKKAPKVTPQAELAKIRRELKQDFEAADRNWHKWR